MGERSELGDGLLKILPSEVRQIGSFQNSINLAFFTLMLGLAVGFGTNLVLSHEAMSDRKFWLFALLTFSSIVFTVYFGFRAFFDTEMQKLASTGKNGPQVHWVDDPNTAQPAASSTAKSSDKEIYVWITGDVLVGSPKLSSSSALPGTPSLASSRRHFTIGLLTFTAKALDW